MAKAEQRSPFAPAPLQDLPHYYGLLRPCAPLRYSRPRGWSRLRLVPSRRRRDGAQVLTFHTKAWLSLAPPTCRMTLGQSQDIPQADPGGRVAPRFCHRLISFRHFISGLLALVSLNRACQNHVPAIPQRSQPLLLTMAACGGLRSAPDCRPPKGLPSSLVQLRVAVWTGDTRDTRPVGDMGPLLNDPSLTSHPGHFQRASIRILRAAKSATVSRNLLCVSPRRSARWNRRCYGRAGLGVHEYIGLLLSEHLPPAGATTVTHNGPAEHGPPASSQH